MPTARCIIIVGLFDVRALFYSGLAALGGAGCLAVASVVARAEAAGTTPFMYGNLTLLCWSGLALAVGGSLGAIVARKRLSQKALCTLIISFSIAVALIAVYTRVAALPRFIGEPMRLN